MSFIANRGLCRLCLSSLLLALPGLVHSQTVLDQIGYTDLVDEVGPGLADGTDVKVAIVEGAIRLVNNPEPTPDVFGFSPDATHPELVGRAIATFATGDPDVTTMSTGHATGVARRFIGSNSSSPGVSLIVGNAPPAEFTDAIYAGNYLAYLGGGTVEPGRNLWDVSNHSYILVSTANNPFTAADATALAIRFDHSIQEGGGTVVVGSSNGRSTNLPRGLVPAYNAISVGRSDGNHGAGFSTFYGPEGEVTLPAGVSGRIKVDIVAPESVTSNATPRVSSAAALLHQSGTALDADSVETETMKAILLAGATKEEFASWDKTATRPLDDRFGAGELNIYNSYQIQAGGQQEGSTTPGAAAVTSLGWDYEAAFDPNNELHYQFTVGPNQDDNELSAILSWNVQIDDLDPSNNFVPDVNLADFNLVLRDDLTGLAIDVSQSEVDNVEHIFVQDLAEGTYTLEVSGDTDQAFGLAWRLSAVPEPCSLTVLALIAGTALLRRPTRV